MPNVPTAYSSLPPATVANDAALKVVARPATAAVPAAALPGATIPSAAIPAAVPAAALPVIRIPGTSHVHEAEVPGERVNPTDILAASARARLAWQTLRPTELTRPAFLANRDAIARAFSTEPGAIGTSRPLPKVEARSYDREAMMNRLEKEGRSAGKTICSGC